ncbi:MAG: hypothetical protein RIR11_111, partial [Bacteroidota bacterium]
FGKEQGEEQGNENTHCDVDYK